jgi:HEAT repeat protein
VNAGKVVSFCSKECASVADSQPVAAAPKVVRAESSAEAAKESAKARRTPPKGVPASAADLDSAPVIQVIHEPATGVVTSAADPRQGRARSNPRAETDGAIQIADTGHIDDYVAPDEPGRSRALLVVLLLVVVAGAGAAAYYLGYLDKMLGRNQVATAPKAVEPPKPVPVDAPPPVSPEAAVERAKSVLREQMKSTPRVQRVAASALARTGDKEAIEQLAAGLGKDSSTSVNLDIAYALARAGDKRGFDALIAAGSGPRESRHDAGRRLAQLGDKRAIRVLEGSLEYEQFRLGVAEYLAYLAEPRAVKVLDDIRKNEKSTPDDKARATIALGRAGRTDVVPQLHELLTDDRNNAFAAVALAELHDEAARPVLVKQLTIPSLRVQAARALRVLKPGADTRDLLPQLLAALESKKDTEQVQIAEAILLLAGPPAWSEHE